MAEPAGTFALLTPPGEGGIAVFAVEGRGARAALCAAVRARRLAALRPGELAYGRLVAADGAVLDEVIVAALPPALAAPGSPSAVVERFELNCHAGGAAAAVCAERLRQSGLAEGAPPEEPGLPPEERAFRRALAGVRTRRQLEALCAARAGRFPGGAARLDAVLAAHRVAIVGPVNAGKSTLFNALCGAERAITSPHPGTTRDAVAAEAAVQGLHLELVDTAGLGAPGGDALAAPARERTRAEAAGAELVLLVIDGSAPMDAAARAQAAALLGRPVRTIVVLNKSDLPGAFDPQSLCLSPPPTACCLPPTVVHLSALTGAGLPELMDAIERELLPP